MTESTKPNLSLGTPPGKLAETRHRGNRVFHGVLVLMQISTFVGVVYLLMQPRLARNTAVSSRQVKELQDAAIALEDRSLPAEAAQVWREYLEVDPSGDDRAAVLYRMGCLMIDAEDYGGAAAAFIQADQRLEDDDELKDKIGPPLVECLRKLGRYGEVGRELSRQVEVDGAERSQTKVLATFAGESFTEADLDRTIEKRVDQMLAFQTGSTQPFTRDQLLAEFASPDARQALLQEILQRELFSRRARDLKLDRDPAFVQARDSLISDMLANQFLRRELNTIQPTEVDLESFFIANQADYRQPETITVTLWPLSKGQEAVAELQQVTSADGFRERARTAIEGEGTAAPRTFVKGSPDPQYGDVSSLFELEVDEWSMEPLAGSDGRALAIVDTKTAASIPAWNTIRDRLEIDYRRRKQAELSQRILQDLMSRYQVRLFDPSSDAAGATEGGDD